MAAPNKKSIYQKHLVVVDCIVFGFFDSTVKTMLVRGHMDWGLVSDIVTEDTVEGTAQRSLDRLPGLKACHLEQLRVYTDDERYGEKKVIAISLCAIGRFDELGFSSTSANHWFAFHELPEMDDRFQSMFAHAKKKLRDLAADYNIMATLFPPKFTIIQLQRIYESIGETCLDKGNFAKRFLSTGVLKRLDEKNISTSKKGSYYYEFDNEHLLTSQRIKRQ